MIEKTTEKLTATEALAEAWASIDGKLEKLWACKADPALDETQGYYLGYLYDAEEMIVRLKRRGYTVVPLEPVPAEDQDWLS